MCPVLKEKLVEATEGYLGALGFFFPYVYLLISEIYSFFQNIREFLLNTF